MTNRSEYAPVECVNIPKMLFQEKQYEKSSVDAKLLYSLLLDRKTLANMNGWIDQNGTAYVVYPKSEMKKHLNASRYRVDMALEELEKCGQMIVVMQPDPGKPCQIYVKDITGNHEKDMETRSNQKSFGLNCQKLGKQLMTEDEIAVMDGGKCILQVRGARPFFFDKYDITKHPNYRFLSDTNPKNWYEIEKEINLQYLPKPDEVVDEVFEVEVLEDEEDSDDESLTSEK